jgi:probable rRNA maturation factor
MNDDGSSTIAVTVGTNGWRTALRDPEALCRTAVTAVLAKVVPGRWLADAEVSLLLSDDATVRRLNASYRGRDRPTNVLSFPALELSPGAWPRQAPSVPPFLGDIVLAEETVLREADAGGRSLSAHFSHLVVHGTLHLLGYDHEGEADALVMEGLERQILTCLGLPDPYPSDDDQDILETTP